MAHGFELGDKAALVGGAGAPLVEVVAAEVGVGLAGGEQMPADYEDRVAHSDRRPSRPAPSPDPGVLRG